MVSMTRRRPVHAGYGEYGEPDDGHRRPIELGPASAYEALTRQMVERMADDLAEIKGRLNGLLFLVAGAVIIDAVTRLAT